MITTVAAPGISTRLVGAPPLAGAAENPGNVNHRGRFHHLHTFLI